MLFHSFASIRCRPGSWRCLFFVRLCLLILQQKFRLMTNDFSQQVHSEEYVSLLSRAVPAVGTHRSLIHHQRHGNQQLVSKTISERVHELYRLEIDVFAWSIVATTRAAWQCRSSWHIRRRSSIGHSGIEDKFCVVMMYILCEDAHWTSKYCVGVWQVTDQTALPADDTYLSPASLDAASIAAGAGVFRCRFRWITCRTCSNATFLLLLLVNEWVFVFDCLVCRAIDIVSGLNVVDESTGATISGVDCSPCKTAFCGAWDTSIHELTVTSIAMIFAFMCVFRLRAVDMPISIDSGASTWTSCWSLWRHDGRCVARLLRAQ